MYRQRSSAVKVMVSPSTAAEKRIKQYRRREPKRRRENFTPPFIHLLQHRMLKSPKAAVFSLAAVALRFRHLRIFQNDGMEEKRREKEEKNFFKKLAKTAHFKRSI